MAAFHEVSFPFAVAFGAVGGPERRTEIVSLASGKEERNSPWAYARRRWDVGAGVKTLDDLSTLLAFFEARRGPLYGFRFADPLDHSSALPSGDVSATDQTIGTGDGVTNTFSLVKTYASGGYGVDRPITKPKANTVLVAVDGVTQGEASAFTVDTSTGVVTFAAAPAAGAVITAGFEFETPVRFDTDRLDISLEAFGAGDAPQIPLVEILD